MPVALRSMSCEAAAALGRAAATIAAATTSRRVRVPKTIPRRRDRAGTKSESALGRGKESDAYWVPDRLELEEGQDLPRALGVGGAVDDALDVRGGGALELGDVAVRTGQVERVHVHVGREHRRELPLQTGEDVNDAAGDIGGGVRLGELDRSERPRLRGDGDDGVPADERRQEARDEPEQRRLLGAEDADDAGRLGHGEVEVRPGDGVRGAEHLGELVRPARVPDDAVDRLLDLGLAGAEVGQLRVPRTSLREARATFWPSAS